MTMADFGVPSLVMEVVGDFRRVPAKKSQTIQPGPGRARPDSALGCVEETEAAPWF